MVRSLRPPRAAAAQIPLQPNPPPQRHSLLSVVSFLDVATLECRDSGPWRLHMHRLHLCSLSVLYNDGLNILGHCSALTTFSITSCDICAS